MFDLVCGLVIGLLVGFGCAIYYAAYSALKGDKKAIDSGMIKLDGRYFLLEEIEK